ncbi:hypothetical protein L596_014517 [Steinernema carpocapsae]|uniref:Uncharacterized protein n=1 Tax=Steinernema carpocapsae TaxID=34508 RepID=A0A4U5ND17_STECR|nr:hypothetical protein L596_014517 [Steinernema carpocapsae]
MLSLGLPDRNPLLEDPGRTPTAMMKRPEVILKALPSTHLLNDANRNATSVSTFLNYFGRVQGDIWKNKDIWTNTAAKLDQNKIAKM